MTTDTITLPRSVVERIIGALEVGNDAFSQAFGGYGFYRPDNPHNFFPDPECCTPEEIANHSAACEAYDKGTYVTDHKDGWITPEVHVTAAPWGIGTYTDECKEITDAITALIAAIETAKQEREAEPVGYVYSDLSGEGAIKCAAIDYDVPNGTPLYTHPQPQVPEWQPIETAPKDGTHILVRSYDHRCPPTVCHWFNDGWHLSVNRNGNDSEYSATEWKEI